MILLSSQPRQQKRRLITGDVSSSPSFWIAQAVGALLVCPPDLIERWLPMVAPFPTTISDSQKRNTVDRILDQCWDGNNVNDNNGQNGYIENSGYEIQTMDEWIVDNQRQMRNEPIEDESQPEFTPSQKGSDSKAQPTQGSTSSKSDSLFSNYFLSLHLLFSLPSLGEDGGDDNGIATRNELNDRNTKSSFAMKPSTYGEITTLGTRQLFGAMGLLNRDVGRSSDPCHFVDLGSGAGKLVGQAVLEVSTRSTIIRATGVELSPSRHQSALEAKRSLIQLLERKQTKGIEHHSGDEWYMEWLCNVHEIDEKLQVVEGDMFDLDLSTATHIYVASLCFPDTLMLRLEEMLMRRIERQQHKHQEDSTAPASKLRWIATLRKFPNDLGGMQPIVRFMEMSWTSPLGCAVYLYPCDATET